MAQKKKTNAGKTDGIINLSTITDRQKLIIKNGINTYLYIMDHATADDLDFRQVYYDFYLSARSSVFAQEKTNTQTHTKEPNPNWDAYFKLLHDSKGSESIKEIVSTLQKNLSSKSLEFSFSTKLLHTKNPHNPIYDSKVRTYLKSLGISLRFDSKHSLDNIEEDWNTLSNWYKVFLNSPDGRGWIAWFDNQFPEGSKISNEKKVDFIIFACVDNR